MNVTPPDIGKMVKEARKAHGLTLDRLSKRTGISLSMLSAIERGTTNPTFSIVWSLVQALGLDLPIGNGAEAVDPIEHVHEYSTPMRRSADGKCELYMLNPRQTVLPVEWYRLKISKGGRLDSEAHALGTYEHLTCLRGKLTVTVNERTVAAASGETLRYRADTAHSIVNDHEGETEAILLVAQPSQYKDISPTA